MIRNAFDTAVFQFNFRHLLLVSSGVNWSDQIAFNARAELVALHVQLDTSATVANREMNLLLNNGSNTMLIGTSPVVQTASQTKYYIFGQHGSYYANAGSDKIYIPITPGLFLLESWTIDSDLTNIQGGDTFRNRVTIYKIWTYEQ